MNAQLERDLIKIALESAVSLYGKPIKQTETAVIFENLETGKKKYITYVQMVEGINSAITEIRK